MVIVIQFAFSFDIYIQSSIESYCYKKDTYFFPYKFHPISRNDSLEFGKQTASERTMTVRLVIVFASLALLWLAAGEVLGVEVALDEFEDNTGRYTIDGKVYSPELFSLDSNWQKDTVVTINDGEFNGFLREDGTFVISNVPSGSYVVDIVNPDYLYESVSKMWLILSVFGISKIVQSSLVSRRDQSEGQIPSPYLELCSTFAGGSGALSAEDEGIDSIQVLPDTGAVKGSVQLDLPSASRSNKNLLPDHRLPLQPNGPDDDSAAPAHAYPTQNDERPGDQKGNGEPQPEQDDQRHAGCQ